MNRFKSLYGDVIMASSQFDGPRYFTEKNIVYCLFFCRRFNDFMNFTWVKNIYAALFIMRRTNRGKQNNEFGIFDLITCCDLLFIDEVVDKTELGKKSIFTENVLI